MSDIRVSRNTIFRYRWKALTIPCGRFHVPINGSRDDKSQIEEYLKKYNDEGIQHIPCGCHYIHASVELLRKNGLEFMPGPPDTSYKGIDLRLPNHGESAERLYKNSILI